MPEETKADPGEKPGLEQSPRFGAKHVFRIFPYGVLHPKPAGTRVPKIKVSSGRTGDKK